MRRARLEHWLQTGRGAPDVDYMAWVVAKAVGKLPYELDDMPLALLSDYYALEQMDRRQQRQSLADQF